MVLDWDLDDEGLWTIVDAFVTSSRRIKSFDIAGKELIPDTDAPFILRPDDNCVPFLQVTRYHRSAWHGFGNGCYRFNARVGASAQVWFIASVHTCARFRSRFPFECCAVFVDVVDWLARPREVVNARCLPESLPSSGTSGEGAYSAV